MYHPAPGQCLCLPAVSNMQTIARRALAAGHSLADFSTSEDGPPVLLGTRKDSHTSCMEKASRALVVRLACREKNPVMDGGGRRGGDVVSLAEGLRDFVRHGPLHS